MIHISVIEQYFKLNGLPPYDVEIIPAMIVKSENAELFVNSHLLTLQNHKGNNSYFPYYFHLLNYYNIVNDTKQNPN